MTYTSHQLAKELLEGPDMPVVLDWESDVRADELASLELFSVRLTQYSGFQAVELSTR